MKRNCASEKEKKKLQRMLEDHKKLLYPNCEADNKKLDTTLELLEWEAENGVSDKGFGKLLVMIKNMLPKDNELPESMYEAKKVVCPLGLEVQKIHACPNDCILYYGEYADLKCAWYAVHCAIRSAAMTLVMSRASAPGRRFLPR